LAILSADTANRIGLSAKTIGRIRMTQPEDPIAFSRFTEGLVVSGDPDYDPEAMLAGDAREKAEAERGASPGAASRAESGTAPGTDPRTGSSPGNTPAYGYEIPRGIEYSDYADYSHGSIVDVQGNSATPPQEESRIADDWEEDWDDRAYSGYPADNGESVEKTNYPVWEQGGSVGRVVSPRAPQTTPQAPAAPDPSAPSQGPMDPWEKAWMESGQGRLMGEARSTANAGENESRASARILASPPPSAEYQLIPAEERPPAGQPPAASPVEPAPPQNLDESLFIEPIEKQREARAAEAARAEEARRAAEAAQAAEAARLAEAARAEEARRAAEAARAEEAARLAEAARTPEPEALILLNGEPQGPWVEPIPEAPKPVSSPPEVLFGLPKEEAGPQLEAPSAPPVRETVRQSGGEPGELGPFSVPVNLIDEMEKGKYYVQLGAYRNAASIESALLMIDSGYPLNVQKAGTVDNPLYRLLVGPLNLGESGALVQRFKGSGYRDAYIRTN
jgi:hypothetical protein